MRRDLVYGCPEQPDVKCGIIGEVASNYPIHRKYTNNGNLLSKLESFTISFSALSLKISPI